MSFTDRKLETGILVLAAALVCSMGYLLKEPVQSVLGTQDVSYEMPRPKQSFLASLFDLGDREISRKYVNPFDKKKATAKKEKDAKAAQAAKPAVAKKAVAKKKTVDTNKKPSVEVNIVGAEPQKTWADDGISSPVGPVASAPNETGRNADNRAPKTEEQLKGDQWRALLMAQPTRENVTKLIAAFTKGDVDDATFYMIMADLYRANKAETQALGLQAAKAVYSTRAFALTAQYFDQLTTELQTQANTYLATYATSARLSILASLLRGNDIEVVTAATEVVLNGYQQARSGVVTTPDPRNSRGDVTINSVSAYSQFIPVFQQLASNGDATIANLANTALSQIQAGVAAL